MFISERLLQALFALFANLVSCLCIYVFRSDIRRRKPHYVSDWMDGFKKPRQAAPAVLFLYFACLAPAISFGSIASQMTNGAIGVVEFILSCGLAGMVRAQLLILLLLKSAVVLGEYYISKILCSFFRVILCSAVNPWVSLPQLGLH
jgi:hypothetical protein